MKKNKKRSSISPLTRRPLMRACALLIIVCMTICSLSACSPSAPTGSGSGQTQTAQGQDGAQADAGAAQGQSATHTDTGAAQAATGAAQGQDSSRADAGASSGSTQSQNTAPITLPYENPEPAEAASAHPWICSDLVNNTGSLDGLSLTDDFHAAVNRDWLSSSKIPSGYVSYDTFTERQLEVDKELRQIVEGDVAISDPEIQKSHRLVKDYYSMWLDWDSRNALGMKPLQDVLAPLEAVKSLKEMTAYLSDPLTTIESLPLCSSYTSANLNDANNYAVYISPPSLVFSDPSYYKTLDSSSWKTQPRYMYAAGYMLERLGYSDDERDRILQESYAFECEMAAHMLTTAEQHSEDYLTRCNNPRTLEELKKEQGYFPLTGMLEAAGVAHSEVFILEQPDWLACMASIYDEAHLSKMKSYLLVQDVLQFIELLDRDCYDRMTLVRNVLSGSSGQMDDKKAAADAVNSVLGAELGEVYAEIYVSDKTREDVTALIKDIIQYYRTMLEGEDFLSDATKAEAVKKLDSLKVRVASKEKDAEAEKASTSGTGSESSFEVAKHNALTAISSEAATADRPSPASEFSESSGSHVLDFSGPQDGGNLVAARIAISEHTCRKIAEQVNQPVDRSEWIASPQNVNAYYYSLDNSINIPAGILGGTFYNDEMSYEEKLARVGVIAAHEISHAFDTSGRQYDEHGNLRNWWTEEDYRRFHARAQKLVDYYSGFEPIPGFRVNGSAIDTEAIADLTGVKCMLQIAAQDEGFDYDIFFRSFASIWRCLTTTETEAYSVEQDNHPCAYLRTNAVVVQFEQFHKTYGTKEGDGMYLAPEYRLEVW